MILRYDLRLVGYFRLMSKAMMNGRPATDTLVPQLGSDRS